MNLEDKIRAVFALPLGFLLGVISSAVITFASLTHWFVLPLYLLIVIALIVFEKVSDKASLRAMEAMSDLPDEELQEMKAKKRVGNHSRLPSYVFIVGCALGYISTFVWSVTEVLNWFA